jgi:integrase
MATLRKKKTKHGFHYVVDFRINGRRHVISTLTDDRKLATQIQHDLQGKIARGTFKLADLETKHISLAALLQKYFEFAASFKRPGTIELERIVTNTFKTIVGNPDLRTLGSETLDRWKTTRLSRIKPVTFNIELRIMKMLFNIAKRWGYIDANPLAEMKKLKIEEKRLYMNDAELRKFFDALLERRASTQRKAYREKLLVVMYYYDFLLNTGLRREEGLALTKDDVDLERGVVHIRKAKDKEARDVPLTKRAKEIIAMLNDELFSVLSTDFVTHCFTSVARDAGIIGFKLHSFRHTFATKMIDAGVDVLTVSKILGHSDIRTTMIYAKVKLDTMKKAAERLENAGAMVTIWLLPGSEQPAGKN